MAIRSRKDKSLPYRKTLSTEISLMKRVDKLKGESSTLITLVIGNLFFLFFQFNIYIFFI